MKIYTLYAACIAIVGLAALNIFWPAEEVKSGLMACLERQKLAGGGDQAAKDAANTLCKKTDAQHQAFKQAFAK
jgi:hypothetical protein